MGTAATHPECQPGLTSLNKMIIITLLSSPLSFYPGYEWAPGPGLIAGCVSIMMSGEMMMN